MRRCPPLVAAASEQGTTTELGLIDGVLPPHFMIVAVSVGSAVLPSLRRRHESWFSCVNRGCPLVGCRVHVGDKRPVSACCYRG